MHTFVENLQVFISRAATLELDGRRVATIDPGEGCVDFSGSRSRVQLTGNGRRGAQRSEHTQTPLDHIDHLWQCYQLRVNCFSRLVLKAWPLHRLTSSTLVLV